MEYSIDCCWFLCMLVSMFIDFVPNRNSPPAILLRESFREGSKVKKRTIANLSSWPASRIEVFRRLLRGELDALPLGISVAAHPAIMSARIMYRFMDDSSNVRALGPRRILDQALSRSVVRIRAAGSLRFPVSFSLPRA